MCWCVWVCFWVCSSEDTSPEPVVKETFLQNRKRSLPGLPVCSILHSAISRSDEVSPPLSGVCPWGCYGYGSAARPLRPLKAVWADGRRPSSCPPLGRALSPRRLPGLRRCPLSCRLLSPAPSASPSSRPPASSPPPLSAPCAGARAPSAALCGPGASAAPGHRTARLHGGD